MQLESEQAFHINQLIMTTSNDNDDDNNTAYYWYKFITLLWQQVSRIHSQANYKNVKVTPEQDEGPEWE